MMRALAASILLAFRRVRFWRRNVHIALGSRVDRRALIGECTRINRASEIGRCTIGAYCAIGGRLVVRSTDHYMGYPNIQDWAQRKVIGSNVRVAGKSKGDVVIGNAVWIGDSVVILPGVKVGNGAVIGAGSVVTKSIPSYAVAVGNPARVVKKRFSDDMIALLEKVQWWQWDAASLRARREFFETDLSATTVAEVVNLLHRLKVNLGDAMSGS